MNNTEKPDFKIIEKELNDLLESLRKNRRKNNYLVSDPLSFNLEVPKWVLQERKILVEKINEYKILDITETKYLQYQSKVTNFKGKSYTKNLVELVIKDMIKHASNDSPTD